MKTPCKFDHNGECLVCDNWLENCSFKDFLNKNWRYLTKKEHEEMFGNFIVGDHLGIMKSDDIV